MPLLPVHPPLCSLFGPTINFYLLPQLTDIFYTFAIFKCVNFLPKHYNFTTKIALFCDNTALHKCILTFCQWHTSMFLRARDLHEIQLDRAATQFLSRNLTIQILVQVQVQAKNRLIAHFSLFTPAAPSLILSIIHPCCSLTDSLILSPGQSCN